MRVSPVIFAITYCVAYVVVLSNNAALFDYYPRTHRFAWGWAPLKDNGPAMAWYGLMASAAIIGITLAVILPHDKLSAALRNRLWLFPMFAMIGCIYLMRHFFLQ